MLIYCENKILTLYSEFLIEYDDDEQQKIVFIFKCVPKVNFSGNKSQVKPVF